MYLLRKCVLGQHIYILAGLSPKSVLKIWRKSSRALPIRQRSSRQFICAYMLPIRDLCATAFCVCPLFFTTKNHHKFRHILRVVFALIATRWRHRRLLKTTHNCAQLRTTTHNGRFYSFISKISFHGSRHFIFTGSL